MSTLAIIGLAIFGWLGFVIFCCALCRAAAIGDEAVAAIERERLLEDDEP